MAVAQRNPNRLLLFNMLPNAEVQKPSVYPLLFIFYLRVPLKSVQSIWFKWPPTITVIQFGTEAS